MHQSTLCLPSSGASVDDGPEPIAFFMAAERSFVAIKPDGVQRGLVGEIVGRFERKGFKLVGLKQITPSRELAEQHYGVHKERPFFDALVKFMTSGPVMFQVLEGENAVVRNREIMGATNPADASAGTLRADYANSIDENAVHGSNAPESAAREIAYFFSEEEICPRTR